jgi:hypothetical protein
MACLIVSLVIVLILFAIAWMIISKIPVPAEYGWLVQVIMLVLFLICILEIVTGGLSFCGVLGGLGHGRLQ